MLSAQNSQAAPQVPILVQFCQEITCDVKVTFPEGAPTGALSPRDLAQIRQVAHVACCTKAPLVGRTTTGALFECHLKPEEGFGWDEGIMTDSEGDLVELPDEDEEEPELTDQGAPLAPLAPPWGDLLVANAITLAPLGGVL